MSENTPSEVTDDDMRPEDHKVLTVLVFTVASASVAVLGTVAAIVLQKTTIITRQNLGHVLETKGKVWNKSKFRKFPPIKGS
jgi:hypothetical protein